MTSVLQSLRLYPPTYALQTVIAETLRWLPVGRSCFEERLQQLKLEWPNESILQRLDPVAEPAPQPSG